MNQRQSEQKILHAAMHEFVTKGKNGARMQSIADRADINKAMLHYYYGSKEKLYKHCLRSVLQNFHAAMEEAIANEDDLETMLDRLIHRFFEFHRSNPGFIQLIARELLNGAEFLHEKNNDSGQAFEGLKKIQKKIKLLQTRGFVRSDIAPLHILMTVIGALGSSMIQALTYTMITGTNFDVFLEKRRDALNRILFAGLCVPTDQIETKERGLHE